MGLPEESGKVGKQLHDQQIAKQAAAEAAKKAERERAKKIIQHQEDKDQGMIMGS